MNPKDIEDMLVDVATAPLRYHGTTTGRTASAQPAQMELPKKRPTQPVSLVEDLERQAVNAQAYADELAQEAEVARIAQAEFEQRRAERDALDQRLTDDSALASATTTLLQSIRTLLLGGTFPGNSAVLAKFRKQLRPLALTYGVDIVLVADKTTATLVKQ